MHYQFKMQILINDLDSLALLIESLPAHPDLTNAGEKVRQAKEHIAKARGELHAADMAERYDI